MIPAKDMDGFERELTSVIGFTPKVGPNDERMWPLSTTTEKDYPHLILRVPRDREEDAYVEKRKGCIYKVAFQLSPPDGEGSLLWV